MGTALRGWLRQPTTIHAIGVLATMAAGFLAFHATGSPQLAIAAGGMAFSAVAGLMNDNTGQRAASEKLMRDVLGALNRHDLKGSLPALTLDVEQVVMNRGASTVTGATGIASAVRAVETAADEIIPPTGIAVLDAANSARPKK